MTLLTEKQAASRLTVSTRTLQTLRSNNAGPAYIRIGGGIRYTEDALDNFIRAHTQETQSPALANSQQRSEL